MLIRPVAADDDAAIRSIFQNTLFLGGPAPFRLARARQYTDLCLDWYLTHGRDDAAVAVDESGRVVGYALVSTDQRAHRRHSWRAVFRFAAPVARAAAIGRLDADNRRFYLHRALDSFSLWSAGRAAPMPVHAHLNVDPSVRSGGAALRLRSHIDDRARAVGAPGWFGEINTELGHREVGLARLGLTVVRRRTNRTLTAVMQRPVVRLTVVRWLDHSSGESTTQPWERRGVTESTGTCGPGDGRPTSADDPGDPQSQLLRRNARNNPTISATITVTTKG